MSTAKPGDVSTGAKYGRMPPSAIGQKQTLPALHLQRLAASDRELLSAKGGAHSAIEAQNNLPTFSSLLCRHRFYRGEDGPHW